MSTVSSYKITPQLVGDIGFSDDFLSAENPISPAVFLLVDLVAGPNTISIPGNSVAVIIAPPIDNEVIYSFKVVDADTGFALHLTNPSIISIGDMAEFVIDADADIVGMRVIFI